MDNSFEKNPLPFPNTTKIEPIKFEDLFHTEVKEHSQSYFQGHLNTVNSIEDAKTSLFALFQHPDVASAHHISYAYTTGEGKHKTDGQNDEGETGASDILKTLIEEKQLTNIFLAVSRRHCGLNLGKRRFEIIRATALDVLSWKD